MQYLGVIWVILIIAGSVIRSISNQKRRDEQKRKPMNQGRPGTPQGRPAPQAHPAAQQSAPRVSPITGKPRNDVHEAKPLEAHMHEPVMGQEGMGTEGIDCCHEYMLTDTLHTESKDLLSMTDTNNEERSKALLQCVIFSEILGRRPIKRYGGHRA